MIMLDSKKLGKHLKDIRGNCKMTQDKVANVLGLSRSAITKIESGSRSVSTLELTKFAELFGQSIEALVSPDKKGDLIVLYRKLPKMNSTAQIDQEVRRIFNLCREGAVLRKILEKTVAPPFPDYSDMLREYETKPVYQGERAAQMERLRLNLGSAPIANVAEMISEQGVWTTATDFPDDLSGLFASHSSVGHVILVNSEHGYTRRRFSYAHEYAHVLFDRNEEEIMLTQRKNATRDVEKRASTFASAFLMPPDGVLNQLRHLGKINIKGPEQTIFDVAGNESFTDKITPDSAPEIITYQEVAFLAHYFGVSYKGVVLRLRNLEYINAADKVRLMKQKDIGKNFIKILSISDSDEKSETNYDLYVRSIRLAIVAYSQDKISRGRFVEIVRKFGFNEDDFFGFAEAMRIE